MVIAPYISGNTQASQDTQHGARRGRKSQELDILVSGIVYQYLGNIVSVSLKPKT